jgi:phosphoribosylformylglycinamidine cyclo-ligase
MARVFNCGLGMIAVVAPADADAIAAVLTAAGEQVHRVGRIVARPAGGPGCAIAGMESAWRA